MNIFGNRKKLLLIIVIIIFSIAIFSSMHVFATGSNSVVSIEAESGNLQGAVKIQNDPQASNGQYILFTATASPTMTPTPTQTSQLTISQLVIADTTNAKNYSLQTNMQQGNILYGDRTYTLKTLPIIFNGSQWIRTANSSKTWNAGKTLMSFTINQTATISVAVDARLNKPSWMDTSWINTGLNLQDNENHTMTFHIYQKSFPAGSVNLGTNGGVTASDMYIVIAQ